jgi:hypothetical protein
MGDHRDMVEIAAKVKLLTGADGFCWQVEFTCS